MSPGSCLALSSGVSFLRLCGGDYNSFPEDYGRLKEMKGVKTPGQVSSLI